MLISHFTEPTGQCKRVEYKEVYEDENTGCRTRKKVKHRKCVGGGGCQAKKTKSRKVRLFCPDGSTYVKDMPVVRKCSCVEGKC